MNCSKSSCMPEFCPFVSCVLGPEVLDRSRIEAHGDEEDLMFFGLGVPSPLSLSVMICLEHWG